MTDFEFPIDRTTLPAPPPTNGDSHPPADLLVTIMNRLASIDDQLTQLEPIMRAVEESTNRTLEVHQQNVEILKLLKARKR